MKKSSTLMLSYIIFLVVAVVVRFGFGWTGIGQVALAATISGCFFAFADLLNWYISYKKPLIKAMKEDLVVFQKYRKTAKEYMVSDIEDSKKSIEMVQKYIDEDNRVKEFVEVCRESIQNLKKMIANIDNYEFEISDMKDELDKDTERLFWSGVLEAVFAICGFIAFFVVLCFNAIVEIVIPYGETVTVLAFAIIMFNYFLRDVLEDKAQKDLADINKRIKEEKYRIEEIKANMANNKCLEPAKKLVELIETCKEMEDKTDGQVEDAFDE